MLSGNSEFSCCYRDAAPPWAVLYTIGGRLCDGSTHRRTAWKGRRTRTGTIESTLAQPLGFQRAGLRVFVIWC